MGKMILSGGLLNNPLAFGLIIGGVILVAVAVILYVLVFRAKINQGIEGHKAKKAEKSEKYDKSVNMAASMFQERETADQQNKADKEAAVNVAELERRIKANQGSDTYLANPKVKKEKKAPKKKEEPEKAAFDTKSQIDQLKQMKGEE